MNLVSQRKSLTIGKTIQVTYDACAEHVISYFLVYSPASNKIELRNGKVVKIMKSFWRNEMPPNASSPLLLLLLLLLRNE